MWKLHWILHRWHHIVAFLLTCKVGTLWSIPLTISYCAWPQQSNVHVFMQWSWLQFHDMQKGWLGDPVALAPTCCFLSIAIECACGQHVGIPWLALYAQIVDLLLHCHLLSHSGCRNCESTVQWLIMRATPPQPHPNPDPHKVKCGSCTCKHNFSTLSTPRLINTTTEHT